MQQGHKGVHPSFLPPTPRCSMLHNKAALKACYLRRKGLQRFPAPPEHALTEPQFPQGTTHLTKTSCAPFRLHVFLLPAPWETPPSCYPPLSFQKVLQRLHPHSPRGGSTVRWRPPQHRERSLSRAALACWQLTFGATESAQRLAACSENPSRAREELSRGFLSYRVLPARCAPVLQPVLQPS